jgi:hypothetical protein
MAYCVVRFGKIGGRLVGPPACRLNSDGSWESTGESAFKVHTVHQGQTGGETTS